MGDCSQLARSILVGCPKAIFNPRSRMTETYKCKLTQTAKMITLTLSSTPKHLTAAVSHHPRNQRMLRRLFRHPTSCRKHSLIKPAVLVAWPSARTILQRLHLELYQHQDDEWDLRRRFCGFSQCYYNRFQFHLQYD